ncbi:SDR family NAD(P)-dependent oxidoreductase [Rhodococcus sp. BP22]|uniref:SDR family NAD(P)-dependent oxidoreductase n=1 Tax=Rhodococcus sp. BP22 TaxID=2758566 RepID=UPI0021BD158F|nr:SDR family NAD(P)-dependent oxidoreductase [Rhodococcus sp. BP22]
MSGESMTLRALHGRRALITGAGSGIGASIADAYAAAGARLFLADRDEESLDIVRERLERNGTTVSTVVVDVADRDRTRAMVEQCVSDLGGVDVLVNSAGTVTESPFVEMEVDMWEQMIAVDLTSVFLCCRWAAPHMVKQGAGRIINIASQLGIKGGVGLVHYSAAKAGVIGLTKALAREMAPHGVLVNAIAPGPIETPLLGGVDTGWKEAMRAALPLGRFGYVEEVSPTAVLLASDPGGNLYVGQVLGPNSGDVMP